MVTPSMKENEAPMATEKPDILEENLKLTREITRLNTEILELHHKIDDTMTAVEKARKLRIVAVVNTCRS